MRFASRFRVRVVFRCFTVCFASCGRPYCRISVLQHIFRFIPCGFYSCIALSWAVVMTSLNVPKCVEHRTKSMYYSCNSPSVIRWRLPNSWATTWWLLSMFIYLFKSTAVELNYEKILTRLLCQNVKTRFLSRKITEIFLSVETIENSAKSKYLLKTA